MGTATAIIYHISMSSITALTATKRDPSRISIKVDGQYIGTVSANDLLELGIAVGTPWTDELDQQVVVAATFGKALNQGMNRLARRMLSSSQLRRKLRGLDHDDAVIDRVIERLVEIGLLDDVAYGRTLVRELMNRKPAGPALLRAKLFEKGLDRGLIDQVVSEACEAADLVEDAVKLAEKKMRSMSRLDATTQKRRLWGALARRGFDSDTIRKVMDRVLCDA